MSSSGESFAGRKLLQARSAAVKTVVEAFTRTSQALEAAGRPGLREFDSGGNRNRRAVGWRVVFDWSTLSAAPPAVTTPPLPSDVVLAAGYEPYFANDGIQWFRAGDFRIGEASLSKLNPYQRIYAWEFKTPAEFAEGVLRNHHVELEQHIPYVHDLARVIAQGALKLIPLP